MISSIDPAPSVISCGGQSALFLSACPQGFQKIFTEGPAKLPVKKDRSSTPAKQVTRPQYGRHVPGRPSRRCSLFSRATYLCPAWRRAYRYRSRLAIFRRLFQPHASHRQKFLEGRGAGRENLFPKRFPSPQAFLSSNLQAPACRLQTKKSPAERGQKKTPSRCELQGGLRTIFGSGLLSHMTLCSIIGDGELNFRVRNGVGCTLSSMATKEIW